MKATKTAIGLSDLIRSHRVEVVEMSEESPALEPESCEYGPIVRPGKNGLVLVDGFSRTAGMVAAGYDSFPAIIVEGADELCRVIDCESVIGECSELDAIYEAAG